MAEQSITISFYSEVAADGSLNLDLDSEMNDDKTQFLYGVKAYFRVFKYPIDMVVELIKSDGTLAEEGSGVSEEEEMVMFVNTDTSSINKPLKSIVSYEWFGTSLGAISAEGNVIKSSISGVGVLKLTYESDFNRHSITIGEKESDEYPVIVFALGS